MRAEMDHAIGTEIKVTVTGEVVPRALEEFALKPDDGSPLDIYFFDAVEPADGVGRVDDVDGVDRPGSLRLFDRSVILRLRIPHGPDDSDSTAKLRPGDRERFVGPWAPGTEHDGKYRVEFDQASRPVLAASLQDKLSRDKAEAVVTGERPLTKAFSDEQEQFLAECGPRLPDLLDGLGSTGPIRAVQWDDMSVPLSAAGGTGKAELWDCGRGLVFLELSARLDTSEAGGALTQLKAELRRRGLHLAAAGTTKTELALRHLLRAPTGVVRS